jgi:hypothetical protein
MTPGFAHAYGWARDLQRAQPDNLEARWLVVLLRCWDDLERKRLQFPQGTPRNLQALVEANITALTRRLAGPQKGQRP